MSTRLRALLIQKDAKQVKVFTDKGIGLRALLIQKDAKRRTSAKALQGRLRALLIQKDAKPFATMYPFPAV